MVGRLAIVAAVGVAAAGAGLVAVGGETRTSVAAIRLGPVVRLPVTGGDSEYPVLAMNASGRYLIAYPENDPFGAFGAVIGTTAADRIPVGDTGRIGSESDLAPLGPAVASDGRAALGWSVRQQGHPAQNVRFGLGLAELTASAWARWTHRPVLAPTSSYDGGDGPAAGLVFGSGDRVLEDWTTRTGSTASLVFAREATINGPFRTGTVLRAGRYTTVTPTALAVDGGGAPVLAVTLTPALNLAGHSHRTRAAEDSAVAFAGRSDGELGSAQVLRRGCDAAATAVAPSGQAAVAIVCGVEPKVSQVWVSERAAGQAFAPPVRVSDPATEAISPSVSIAADGQVWVTWDRVVGSEKRFDANIVRTEITRADAGTAFPPPAWQTGSYPTQLNGPTLLAGPGGPALARGDGRGRVVLQRLLPGGRLGPVVALSEPSVRNQQLAVDSAGRGVAVWDGRAGGRNVPEARSFALP